MNLLHRSHRYIVAIYGDEHGGNKLGLANPDARLLDPTGKNYYHPQLNDSQSYLHEMREKHVQQVIEFADGDDLYILNLGDITQGSRYPVEILSTRIPDQIQIARSNFWYWFKYRGLKAIRLVVGTAAHNFGEMTAEEFVMELLKSDKPNLDIRLAYHGLLNLKGTVFDYAHRGPTSGRRNWLKGNEARLYLRSLMEDEFHFGNIPPHMILRGHYHSFVEEYLRIPFLGKRYGSWLYVLPSYCLLGEFGHNATSSQFLINNGMIVTEVIDGQVGETLILEQTLDIRTKEEIQ